MDLLKFIFLSVILMKSDGFTVHGPSGPLVVPLGSSVVLPCYVDELLLMEGLKVEWRRTDSETLVHLYQDGESRPEAQQQDYHGRAHFFTDQIQHGNFSLRLDNLTAEDEGQYTCKVHSQKDYGETVVQIKDVVYLVVSGSDKSISASVGEDVTLNCSVDSHIKPEHFEEVLWKKTDEDEYILVLLYQNNETIPGSSDERYRDRVEFFTDEIPKGNFSLRLKSVRTEDKGVYICQVFAGGLSANATVELDRLGFSVLHVMVLILCISASGSVLLLCSLIYCRSCNTEPRNLQVCLVFCPNMIMVFAFGFWGFSEGFLNESVLCSGLYFLRPLMLFCSAPCIDEFTEEKKEWIKKYTYRAQYVVFSAVVYSVLLKSALDRPVHAEEFDYRIIIIALFVIMLLLSIIYICFILATLMQKLPEEPKRILRILARLNFDVQPSVQFIFMFFAFGIITEQIFIVAVLPVFLAATNYDWEHICGAQMGCFGRFFGSRTVRSAWLISVLLLNGLMVFFYYNALQHVKDYAGWACMIAFLQLLWIYCGFSYSYGFELHRVVPVYLFGSVGVVLLNSVAMMAELILKTVNGNPAVGDLRVIVFPSEFFFTLSLLICLIFSPWMKKNQQPPQNAVPY